MVTRNANTVTRHSLPLWISETVVPALAASAHDTIDTSIPRLAAMNVEFHASQPYYPEPRLDGVALEWLPLPKNR